MSVVRSGQAKDLLKNNPKLKVGILGCMAERLKEKLLEDEVFVDIVAGPDAYRDLPAMLNGVKDGRQMANVVLSLEETYDDIKPVRLDAKGVSGFISIIGQG